MERRGEKGEGSDRESLVGWSKEGGKKKKKKERSKRELLAVRQNLSACLFFVCLFAIRGDYYCQVMLSQRPGEKLALLQPTIKTSKPIAVTIVGESKWLLW